MNVLIFGDIVGSIGREAVLQSLPGFREQTNPDLVLANCENLAGGRGVTPRLLKELLAAGIDAFTSGNHLWDRPQIDEVLREESLSAHLARPANYPQGTPGGDKILLTVGGKRVLVLNFIGRVFSQEDVANPFLSLDEMLQKESAADIVLVDFHAEATSEKVVLGWYADGRVAAVWGTHTHVPTRDERILPKGTAYISDVGMSGFRDGIIGVERDPVLRHFTGHKSRLDGQVPRSGEAIVNALSISIANSTGKAISVEHLQKIIALP